MRIPQHTLSKVIVSVALTMIAGCTGSDSQLAPGPSEVIPSAAVSLVRQQTAQNPSISNNVARDSVASSVPAIAPSFFDPHARIRPLIFISDRQTKVNIFLQARKDPKIGQITGLHSPQGLATDASRNLYVVDGGTGSGANADVLVYTPPYTGSPKLILNDPGYEPNGVAVSPSGVVAVANYCTFPSCGGPSSVVLYAKNSTKPCATVIADLAVLFDAFDQRGNLYIDGFGTSRVAALGEISGECKAKKIKSLTTSNHIGVPEGIQVDKAGRIAILDQGDDTIYAYNPPHDRALGNPVSTTPLLGISANTFVFLASGVDLYAGSNWGDAGEYHYPAGGTAKKMITTSGSAWGLAVTPALIK